MTENKENKVGKPTVFTPEILKKLEEAFAIGATDSEACFYADVSSSAFYEYQNRTEGYLERKKALKEKPILKARQELIKGLEGNPELALKYLERKRKSEFSLRTELTGEDGKALLPEINITGIPILIGNKNRDVIDNTEVQHTIEN